MVWKERKRKLKLQRMFAYKELKYLKKEQNTQTKNDCIADGKKRPFAFFGIILTLKNDSRKSKIKGS